VQKIAQSGQIVFHAVGDTGNTRGLESQNPVDGMVAPGTKARTLAAFLENFCAAKFEVAPDPDVSLRQLSLRGAQRRACHLIPRLPDSAWSDAAAHG